MSQNPQDPNHSVPQYGQRDPQQGVPSQASTSDPYGQAQSSGQHHDQYGSGSQYGYGAQGGAPQYGQQQDPNQQYGGQPQGAPQYGGPQYGGEPYGAPQYAGQDYAATGRPQSPAPSAVTRGTQLIYAACGLAIIGAILSGLGQKVVGTGSASGVGGTVASILGAVLVAVIGAVLAFLASRGTNWARITSVVFGGIAVLRLIIVAVSIIGIQNLVSSGEVTVNAAYYIGYVVVVLSHVLYIVGNVFYLLKPARAWYRSAKYPQQQMY